MRKIVVLLFLNLLLIQYAQAYYSEANSSKNFKNSRYDYVYANPPRQSLDVWGRYIYSNSKVRYIHSPSRLKRAAHAARINANNYEQYNY